MTPVNARPPEIALPVASLAALRHALTEELGADRAAHALRSAGGASGHALFRAFVHASGRQSGTLDEETARAVLGDLTGDEFWDRFSSFFATRGWGRFRFDAVHPGVGALRVADGVEADPDAGAARPSCFFTTGMLAGLLGRVTGSEVAVLEVECRSQGQERCTLLFGAPTTLEALFREVVGGRDLDASLAALAPEAVDL